MVKRLRAAMLVWAASWLWACEAPTDPSSTDAEVELTASPNPASGVSGKGVFYTVDGGADEPDETREYDWKTSFTVALAETAGVGLDITALSVKVQQATGGIITPPTTGDVEHYQFLSQASGNRLEGNGRASVGFDVWYDLPNLGREAVVTVTFTFHDEKDADDEFDDYSFTESVEVRVQ